MLGCEGPFLVPHHHAANARESIVPASQIDGGGPPNQLPASLPVQDSAREATHILQAEQPGAALAPSTPVVLQAVVCPSSVLNPVLHTDRLDVHRIRASCCAPPCLHPLSDAPLMSSGLDSLGAVELRNSLEARLRLSLPPTLVFDYPTADALTQHLVEVKAQQAAADGVTAASALQEHAAPAGKLGATGAARRQMPVPPLLARASRLLLRAPLAVRQTEAQPLAVLSLVEHSPLSVAHAVHGLGSTPRRTGSRRCDGAPAAVLGGAAAEDAVAPVPLQRWDVDLGVGSAAPGGAPREPPGTARFMACLPHVQSFDAGEFGARQWVGRRRSRMLQLWAQRF
eukprot:363687-Chlamydomonas_euryale.AAC.7